MYYIRFTKWSKPTFYNKNPYFINSYENNHLEASII